MPGTKQHIDARAVVRRMFLNAMHLARGRYAALQLDDQWIARTLHSSSAGFVRQVFWELLQPGGAIECDPASRRLIDSIAPGTPHEALSTEADAFLQHTRIHVRITPLGERILEHLRLDALADDRTASA